MFTFHSVPLLSHLRTRPYRDHTNLDMAPSPSSFPAPPVDQKPTQPFRFLDLPLELREQVYSLYFKPADRLRKSSSLEGQGFYGGVYGFEFGVCGTCRQVAREARKVWRREVRTVKIGTPWPSAVNHISSEGLVPIICTDERADSFGDHVALIQISAPFHQAVPDHTVVLLLDDLHLFTQTWYYSALSYPMLNDRLSTAFILRDPDMDDVESDVSKAIPLALQRRLLLPFSQVKGLYSLSVSGFHKSIERELRTAMAIPAPTLPQSCETATKLLQEGDSALARSDATEALRAYQAAFHAIHILIKGRTRRVLADTFFHANITTGIYAGQTGMTVRVILRLRLVARIISTYLVQRNWAEAAFWGMRSVRIMSEAMDTEFEDFLADLVGGDDVALVYIRAGIALLKMRNEAERFRDELVQYDGEGMADTTRLFSVSLKHLKRGTGAVKRELESYDVPRPLILLFDESEERSEDGSETVNVDPTEHVGVGGVLGWF